MFHIGSLTPVCNVDIVCLAEFMLASIVALVTRVQQYRCF